MFPRRALLGSAILVLSGCSGTESKNAGPVLVFEKDVRANYAAARACRSPGEHSGISAFTVWTSKDAASAFAGLWETPPSIDRLPAGAVVVKEVYSGTECRAADLTHWVAMRKEPGFDPGHADWHWQKVTADGHVEEDGAISGCIDCHEGGDDASCIGYGERNGRDYTCTVPDTK